MIDIDTFLTTLYVMVDDFCKTTLLPERHPGLQAAITILTMLNRATQHRYTGSTRKRVIAVRPGHQVYESCVV